MISDQITPRIIPEMEILPFRSSHVLAVQIHPSPTRPHSLKKCGKGSGVFVRVGSTNRSADEQLVAEMLRFSRGEAFDQQPMPELSSEAIDFRVASELFEPVRRLRRADLETLQLATSYQGHEVPTVCCCSAGSVKSISPMPGSRPAVFRVQTKAEYSIRLHSMKT